MTATPTTTTLTGEQADLLKALALQRGFLRFTARDLTDDEARRRTTVSELCIASLLKHVAAVERSWTAFIREGPSAIGSFDESAIAAHAEQFRVGDDDTLASLLDAYAEVAGTTDDLVAGLTDLDASHPLPEAPWFEAGATWSARQALLHIIAETAQHAGHADIIREAIDGAKTMG